MINGLVDQMSWIVPQLSEKTFSINADTAKTAMSHYNR